MTKIRTSARPGLFTLARPGDLLAAACIQVWTAGPARRRGMLNRRRILASAGSAVMAGMITGKARAADPIKIDDASVLLVVDVQNCFLPGGSLAVKDGDQVIPVINRIAKGFANVVMTQDWHTPHHISFASTHEGKKPFEVIKLAYGNQVLWPDHCV